jgi:predicted Zn-dependent peptidase
MLEKLNVKYHTKILANNIRVDLYEKRNAPIEIRFNILGGDIYNPDLNKKGLAHFMEHIFCAGNQEFPSKDKLALYLDSFGGYFGGTTSLDKMWLRLGCPDSGDVEKLFQVLSSCLERPLINELVLETEKGSIFSEFNQKLADNTFKVYLEFMKSFYSNSEYRNSVFGTFETIKNFSISDLQDWQTENMVGGKIGICVTGDISIEELEQYCNKYLSFILSSEVYRKEESLLLKNESDEVVSNFSSVKFVQVQENNSFIMLAFKMGGLYEKNFELYNLFTAILGGYGRRSSLLSKKLRYESGLSYSPVSYIRRYFDTGYFCIEINCKFEDINKVIEIINKIIVDDFEKELTEERFNLELARFNKILPSQYEKNSEFLNFGSLDTLTQVTTNFNESYKRVNEIKYDDFLKIGRKFLRDKNWFIAYYGKEQLELKEIAR